MGPAALARDGLVHVIAPPASHPCREPWVKAYRTALIDPEDVVTHPDGLRLTSPSRTVVDLTRYVDPFALTSIVEHAISSGLCSETAMERTAARLATPGRSWARRFLRTLASRHPGAAAESEGELRVFRALVRAGAVALVRQHVITLPGYGPARFDMAIPPLRWALEVDLHPEHRTPEGRARDSLRDVAAEGLGWRVRRVGEVELDRRRLPTTIAALVTEIERRRADVAALVGAGLWSPRCAAMSDPRAICAHRSSRRVGGSGWAAGGTVTTADERMGGTHDRQSGALRGSLRRR